jgi:hypothetical protein
MNMAVGTFPSSPTLLCLWHANKAIVRHCQPAFGLKSGHVKDRPEDKEWDEFYRAWHSITASPTEKIFEERWASFKSKYVPKYIQEVGYIQTYWLEPHKEKIVKAWVDKHLHFGNVVTSR